MVTILLVATALALPPSSTLTSASGATLTWTITPTSQGVTVDGRSPKWTVHHEANADLTPRRTVRSDAAGRTVTVDYAPDRVVVHLPEKVVNHDAANVWDGDTIDVRLGHLLAAGKTRVTFQAVDPASGDLYGFATAPVGQETCGTQACTHIHVNMTGIYRLVGPSFDYWYAADGQLLRFEGPAGTYAARGAP
jgi:hypothetical protein